MDPKPGRQTTEFWLTLIGNVLAFAVALGVVSTTDKATIEGALTTIVTSAIALIGASMTIVEYIKSRLAVKTQAHQQFQAFAAGPPNQSDDESQWLAASFAGIPNEARQEAKAAGMPILTLLLLAFQYRDDLKKLLDAIRVWRK